MGWPRIVGFLASGLGPYWAPLTPLAPQPPPPPAQCSSTTYDGPIRRRTGPDYWPTLHGPDGMDAGSPYEGPQDLRKSLAWTWQHPQGRYYTFFTSVLIDDKKDIYLAGVDAMRKFSPDGVLLWTYCKPSGFPLMTSVPTLMDGVLHGDVDDGLVFAVNATTGREIWTTRLEPLMPLLGGALTGGDTRVHAAYDGMVFVATERCRMQQCYQFGNAGGHVIRALSAKDGSQLWTYKPDAPVWNFYVIFTGDGTFAYQDLEGRLYRNRLSDGTLIWKRGGIPGSWNDGSAGLGPAGILLAAVTNGPNNETDGHLAAYRYSDGEELWRAPMIAAPNAYPALGPCARTGETSIVMTTGPPIFDVYCLEAKTGKVQWQWKGPRYPLLGPKGDRGGVHVRKYVMPQRIEYAPNVWGNAVVDSRGTVFVGFTNGYFYAIRDANGDGIIDRREVQALWADAAFAGSSPAMAPGILAVAALDTLHVFKT